MPEASGENVAASEDTTAGSPKASDIVASNSMDFLPVDQPHIKCDEEEGETTSESPDLSDTAASHEKRPPRLCLVVARMTIYYTDSAATPLQILLLIKRENSEDTD